MRKEIIMMQKEYLKTLLEENKQLSEENNVLLAHVGNVEHERATKDLETKLRERRRSPVRRASAEDALKVMESERNLAVEKIASLSDEVSELTRAVSRLHSERSEWLESGQTIDQSNNQATKQTNNNIIKTIKQSNNQTSRQSNNQTIKH